MFEFRLFGPGQAQYFGQPLNGFPDQQPFRLLSYLLLNRYQPHHRERLAAVFWSKYPTRTSRKNLRNALWRLRQGLESVGACIDDYLSVGDDSVSFSTAGRHWLDVEVFETAITRYADVAGQNLTLEQATDLEQTVDLYIGDLLESVYDDWCLYDRERLRLQYLKALGKLMVFHGVNGNYEHGLACGKSILACDDTRERVHRRMMWLYWRIGDRSAALAQYNLCDQVLREELGAPPMRQTKLLYEQMVHNQFDPGNWPIDHDVPLYSPVDADESVQLLVEQALQRLRRLSAVMEETTAELESIEDLINRTLIRARQP